LRDWFDTSTTENLWVNKIFSTPMTSERDNDAEGEGRGVTIFSGKREGGKG